MKKCRLTTEAQFRIGELYLFHTEDASCPPETSLWGFYDSSLDGTIYLEHSTSDLRHFRLWHKLPESYCYYRLASRSELRDYMYNLGRFDSK